MKLEVTQADVDAAITAANTGWPHVLAGRTCPLAQCLIRNGWHDVSVGQDSLAATKDGTAMQAYLHGRAYRIRVAYDNNASDLLDSLGEITLAFAFVPR